MKKWIIYLLICIPEEKGYVGQTCQKVESRCSYKTSYRNGLIGKVFSQYGPDNFVCIPLEEDILSQELADERERYWISYCHTNDSRFGYNVQAGGKSGHKGGFSYQFHHGKDPRGVIQFTKDMKIVAKYESADIASSKTNISSSSIRSCCNGNQVTAGKYKWKWSSSLTQ